MRYLVRARVKPGCERQLLKAIEEDAEVEVNEVDDIPGLAAVTCTLLSVIALS